MMKRINLKIYGKVAFVVYCDATETSSRWTIEHKTMTNVCLKCFLLTRASDANETVIDVQTFTEATVHDCSRLHILHHTRLIPINTPHP